jgi:hypothetical protein
MLDDSPDMVASNDRRRHLHRVGLGPRTPGRSVTLRFRELNGDIFVPTAVVTGTGERPAGGSSS